MQEGRKVEVLGKVEGVNGPVRVKVPKGEFLIDPRMLEHIRGLERTIESLEEDRAGLIAEMRVRGEV